MDKVVSTTTSMAPKPSATSRKMSMTSTISPDQTGTVPIAVHNSVATSRASFIVSATSTLKTTYKTTTEKITPPTTTSKSVTTPTTTSKRTPEPSITLILTKTPPTTTTSRPTTTPTTTTPTPTTTTPTTTSTTPTTTSTTPTTTSTTPTTTSTTPTTTSTTPTTTTTRRPTTPTTTTTRRPTSLTTTTSKPITTPSTVPKPTTTEKLIATCPHEWVIHENSCYHFHLDHQRHPQTALTMCERSHSYLVHLNTEDEQQMIEQYLQNNQDYQNMIHNSNDSLHDSAILTGGVRKDGHVAWKDTYNNSTTPITYHKWNHRYPHHFHEGNEYLIAMIGSEQYTWRDFRPFPDTFYFICERPVYYQANPPPRFVTASTTSGKDHTQFTHTTTVTTTTQTTKPTTTQSAHHGGHIYICPSGWVKFESSCYSFHLTNRHSHTYSVDSCHHYHAELVSINSKEEQEMIFHHIRSISEYRHELEHFHDIHDVAIWMGAEYTHGHFWQWTDTHHRMEYTNWSNHYPYHHLNSGSCAAFIGKDGHWRDFDCDDDFFYICEKPATRQSVLIG